MANYIYTWHDRRFHAIKIGSSSDPEQRMLNYGLALHLMPRATSLRKHKLSRKVNAKQVLVACHMALRQLRLRLIDKVLSPELYGLTDESYDVVSIVVLRAAMAAEVELLRADNDNRLEIANGEQG